MRLASTRQALFTVVQRTDHLCHLGFHIFLHRLAIAHLRICDFRDELCFIKFLVNYCIIEHLWDKGQDMYPILLQKCGINSKLDCIGSCSCA